MGKRPLHPSKCPPLLMPLLNSKDFSMGLTAKRLMNQQSVFMNNSPLRNHSLLIAKQLFYVTPQMLPVPQSLTILYSFISEWTEIVQRMIVSTPGATAGLSSSAAERASVIPAFNGPELSVGEIGGSRGVEPVVKLRSSLLGEPAVAPRMEDVVLGAPQRPRPSRTQGRAIRGRSQYTASRPNARI